MSETPKISICIITYNHGDYIAEALDSVLSQNLTHSCEVIIADDCSTDNTREVIDRYALSRPDIIRTILQEKNVGPSENFLSLLNAAKGEYVACLEGDDFYVDPYKLQKQVDFLDQNPELGGCFHDLRIIDSKGHVLDENYPLKLKHEKVTVQDLIEAGNNSQTNSRVYRRSCIENMPEWYATFASDFGLEILVAKQGGWGYIDEVMSAYRVHGTGGFTSVGKAKQSLFIFTSYKHLLQDKELSKQFGDMLRFRLRHFALEIARAYRAEGKHLNYLRYLRAFIRYCPKDLKLMKFLIKQELFGARDKVSLDKPAYW